MKPTDLRGILQYIPRFREKTFIISIDGAIVTDENFANILLDVAVLRSLNIRVVLVHGGFLPDQPWRRQPARVVTRIQVVDRDGEPRKRAEAPDAPHWSEVWRGPPFVVYGHTPREDVERTKWTIGIDTGCAQGGSLTAYILPEGRIVQVRARRRYHDPS